MGSGAMFLIKKDFFKNKMAEHAVIRNIEVIGEASKRPVCPI